MISRCGAGFDYFESLPQARARAARSPDPEIGCAEWNIEDPTRCNRWQVRTTAEADCSTSVSGRVPPEAVQTVVRQNHGRFRQSYARGLDRDPNLSGRATLRFVIAKSGEVVHASTEGALPYDVTSCMSSAASSLRVPASGSGTIFVSYPLLLTPEP